MEFQMTDDVLTIFLSGRIKADNASAVDAELSKIIKSNPSNALVLDATDLEYIASAGLRVLMKCRKASKKKVAIQNVSKAVFDVLEMTSFTKLFEVSKKPREISIEGCPQVGMGLSSKVYRLDPETIVKVYDRKVPFYKISREIDLAKKAFVLGVPTAISYDLVNVDGAYGVVFEMIADATAVGDALQANDCRDFDEIMKKFATLLKTLHQTEATKDSGLPSIKGTWLDWAKGMSAYYTQEEYDMLRRLIEEIPDRNTLVHCDFHAGNTLYQDGEVVVIDMADFGFGHPVFDFAAGSFASRRKFSTLAELVGRKHFAILEHSVGNVFRDERSDAARRDRSDIPCVCIASRRAVSDEACADIAGSTAIPHRQREEKLLPAIRLVHETDRATENHSVIFKSIAAFADNITEKLF